MQHKWGMNQPDNPLSVMQKMTKKSYKDKLLDPRWQKKRLQIFEKENFTCQYCGDKDSTLHVHHLHYRKNENPWDIEDSALLCVCSDCHELEHIDMEPFDREIWFEFTVLGLIGNTSATSSVKSIFKRKYL
jgi:hypothetical protein